DLHGSYARRRLIRLRASRPDNKNRGYNNPTDAGGEICSPRNFGSANAAKEYAQRPLPSSVGAERGSRERGILTTNASSEKPDQLSPPLNPLPVSGARRRTASARRSGGPFWIR